MHHELLCPGETLAQLNFTSSKSKWAVSLQINVPLIDGFPFFFHSFLTNVHSMPTEPAQPTIEQNTD